MVDKQAERVISEVNRSLLSDAPLSMVLTDPYRADNPIIYVNRAFELTTGYSSSFAVGKNCRFLQGDDKEQIGIDKLRAAVESCEPVSVELRNYTADGQQFTNRLTIAPLYDDNGELYAFLGVQIRLGDQERSLDDVNTLLEELRHRVKNHLQMVASLIRVQPDTVGVSDSFKILSRRVEALALLYDDFSRPPSMKNAAYDVVSSGAYVTRVASAVGALDGRNGIRVNIDADPVYMSSDRAAKIGLISSEIISNALEHAFGDREEGIVEVRFKEMGEDRFRLTISDDGKGLGNSGWPNGDGMGSKIVRSLIRAIDAKMDIASSDMGTTVRIDFVNRGGSEFEEDSGDRKKLVSS